MTPERLIRCAWPIALLLPDENRDPMCLDAYTSQSVVSAREMGCDFFTQIASLLVVNGRAGFIPSRLHRSGENIAWVATVKMSHTGLLAEGAPCLTDHGDSGECAIRARGRLLLQIPMKCAVSKGSGSSSVTEMHLPLSPLGNGRNNTASVRSSSSPTKM